MLIYLVKLHIIATELQLKKTFKKEPRADMVLKANMIMGLGIHLLLKFLNLSS